MRYLVPALILLIAATVPHGAAAQRAVPADREQVMLSFAPLVRQASPAVVNVFTRKAVRRRGPSSPLFNDPFFRRFFGDSLGLPRPRERVENSLGSGVIVRPDGLTVTNFHVIEGADSITVVLSDRREFEARILREDERTDLAILKIDAGVEELPHIALGDSDDLEVGDLVLAIGNPFGVGKTVTSGIVSGLARTQVGISDFNFFIQTDAAINPGNSGGPLLDSKGRLIGMNTAIFSPSGAYAGIGFAVPVDDIDRMVPELLAHGKVTKPGLGVTIANEAVTRRLNVEGILILNVVADGPAAKAGLRATARSRIGQVRLGDVIVRVDDTRMKNVDDLFRFLDTKKVGDKVTVEYLREGKLAEVEVTLERVN